ncbi:tetratricopeptide repeat-containing response regulator [Pleionea sediminis]|uniref:tetratricopeptide repeat-containing response regulator n=1 Tax=Pleionea sediminis TaxID=2569479 RepID=UPI001184B13A|nr:tetratricopeptide repeat-containing response regulator [Pleionea sediminis]
MINYEEKKALIIEDFQEFARSLKGMLGEIGIEDVDLVNTGESAIRACTEKKYDIVLSDYNLGDGKNGMQILEELHHFKHIRSDTVFIMTTAENTTAMVMGAIENQPDAYLTKPFNNAQLKSRLSKLLTKKEALSPIFKAIDKGKIKQAIELCDALMESHPKYKMAIQKIKAECMMKKRQYSKAMEIFESILAGRQVPWAMIGLAKSQMSQRQYETAESVLKETIVKFPMVLEAYDLLAECQSKQGMLDEAQKTLQQAIKKSPRVIKRQLKLGNIAVDNRDFDTSIGAFKQSIKLGNNSIYKTPDSYIKYTNSVSSKITEDEGNAPKALVSEAESYIKDFYKTYRDDKICTLRGAVVEGNFFKSRGKTTEAQKNVERAKKIYSELETMLPAETGLELAQGLDNLGEATLAQEMITDAIQHNFEDSHFLERALPHLKDKSVLEKGKEAHKLNSKGIKHFENKEFDKAVKCFTKAVEASPKNISIILNTVQVLLKVHQSGNASDSVVEQCLTYLNSINTLAPTDPRFDRFSELMRLTRVIQQEQ